MRKLRLCVLLLVSVASCVVVSGCNFAEKFGREKPGTAFGDKISDGLTAVDGKTQFTACLMTLTNIKMGIETYMTQNNGLQGIGAEADEICHQIMPGYTEPSGCAGEMRKFVEAACPAGSFSVTSVGDLRYNIQAMSGANCCICMTESMTTPETYDSCTSSCECGR